MRARKCDRCGKFYEHYDGGNANVENANAVMFVDRDMEDRYFSRKIYDLCGDCMSIVISYITGKEAQNDTSN